MTYAGRDYLALAESRLSVRLKHVKAGLHSRVCHKHNKKNETGRYLAKVAESRKMSAIWVGITDIYQPLLLSDNQLCISFFSVCKGKRKRQTCQLKAIRFILCSIPPLPVTISAMYRVSRSLSSSAKPAVQQFHFRICASGTFFHFRPPLFQEPPDKILAERCVIRPCEIIGLALWLMPCLQIIEIYINIFI